MIWLLAILMLFLPSAVSAQDTSGIPHSGIGPCPSGQVVNRLNANAGPSCVPGGAGSAFPLTSNVSGAGHLIQSLGAGASSGDAISYLQSNAVLNGLALNGMQLTGLGPATGNNQALAYGQTGALLNGLNLNSNQVSNLSNASASGQAVNWGQQGTQLIDVRLIPAATFPGSPTIGDQATVNTATVCISGSTIVLGGSGLCVGTWNGSNWIAGGGSSGAAAGPINTLPSQTAIYHANKQAFDQLANMTADTTSPRSMSGFNTDNEFNVIAYGADPTAAADSSAAFQLAVNAACAAQQNVSGGVTNTPGVWMPAGQYLLLKPIIVTCAGGAIHVRGAPGGGTALIQKTNAAGAAHGPIFLDTISTAISSIAPVTATSLATGSGVALNFAGALWMLDMSEVMRDSAANPFNGDTGFDIRAYAKLTSTQAAGAVIFCSNGSAAGQNANALKFTNLGPAGVQGGGACLYVDGNNALRCGINIGGTLKQATSANSAFTTATLHEAECSYDGSNVRLFLDGTIVQTVAATGNVSQRVDEDMTIGGSYSVFPLSGAQTLWVGQLDSIEVANTARNTANYTMHTAKYAADSHTHLLINGDITVNMPGSSTPMFFGLDGYQGNTPGSGMVNAWVSVHNIALAQGSGNSFLDFSANGSIGLEATLGTFGNYFNLSLTGPYAGLLVGQQSFLTTQTRLFLSSSVFAPYMDVGSSGATTAKDIRINACGAICAAIVDSGGSWNHLYTAPQANTLWSLLVDNAGSSYNTFKFDTPTLDVESGGNSTAALIVGLGTYTFSGGGLTAHGTQSPIEVSSTDSHDQMQISLRDVPIAFTAIASGGPSTLFNVLGPAPVNGAFSALLENETYSNGGNQLPALPLGIDFTNNSAFQVQKVSNGGWSLANNVTWPLPTTVDVGGNFFCPNCDPANNPPTDCTMTKSATPGSWVRGVNGRWLCY